MSNKKTMHPPHKRHTHSTNAGLEDALAVLLRSIIETLHFMRYLMARLRRARDIIRAVRKGPNAYDPNQRSDSAIRTRSKK